MEPSLLYQIALTFIPHIGPVQAKLLLNYFGDAASIFKAKKAALESIEGIGTVRANSIKKFEDYKRVEAEIKFMEKFKILPLFITSSLYPKRLLNCYDPPTLLYYRGNADLNCSHIVTVIGTRSNTEYGKQLTENLIKTLSELNVLIISGLAFGIDGIAHKAALKNNLNTVGILAHGLDTIYPHQHTGLAKEMLRQGGLLTEFTSNTKPDKHNFPTRNRIAAGMSDATIVVETGTRGGSMITAELANGYNRDVFAFPGKTTDAKSTGCNYLIKNNKAMLISDPIELGETLGWSNKKKREPQLQTTLFMQLTADEKIIVNILKEKETIAIDELTLHSQLSSSKLAAAILNLELQAVICQLPGKMYKLL
jgi:DNA processing protein